jgi:ribosomal protein S7
MQWLMATRNRSGRSSVSKLTNEVMDAANKTGAIKRRDEVHRMAEAIKLC